MRPSSPEISIIIPCYNAAATIGHQLDALARQSAERSWEVIIADNGSTDALGEAVAPFGERIPKLRIVGAAGRGGASHARNVAVRHSQADDLLFCDADDVVGDGWLQAMDQALVRHDFVAGPLDFERLNDEAVRTDRGDTLQDSLMQGDFLPYAAAANMGVKRDIYEDVGGFDTSVAVYHDVDFCWRVQRRGVPLTFVPEAVVHYRCRESLRGTFKQALAYGRDYVLVRHRHGVRSWATTRDFWPTAVKGLRKQLRVLPSTRSRSDVYRWTWRTGWFVGDLVGLWRIRKETPVYEGELPLTLGDLSTPSQASTAQPTEVQQ